MTERSCLPLLDQGRLPFEPSGGATLEGAVESIRERRGPGAEMLGWLDLPLRRGDEYAALGACARRLRQELEALVVIGIGGSYLGSKALIEALGVEGPEIHFAGHHLEASYYETLLDRLRGRAWGILVISKSGTTTEPAGTRP